MMCVSHMACFPQTHGSKRYNQIRAPILEKDDAPPTASTPLPGPLPGSEGEMQGAWKAPGWTDPSFARPGRHPRLSAAFLCIRHWPRHIQMREAHRRRHLQLQVREVRAQCVAMLVLARSVDRGMQLPEQDGPRCHPDAAKRHHVADRLLEPPQAETPALKARSQLVAPVRFARAPSAP